MSRVIIIKYEGELYYSLELKYEMEFEENTTPHISIIRVYTRLSKIEMTIWFILIEYSQKLLLMN